MENVSTKVFWKSWSWLQWVVILLALIIAVKEVYQRQVKRLAQLDRAQIEVVEEDIEEFKTQAERLAQLEVLPPVRSQWNFVSAIARKYGVTLHTLGSGPRPGMYDGPLVAWHGELKGSVTASLVAAQEIQKAVPTYLYKFSASGGSATVAFSVLGSE
jgi:hypothetical protein